MVTENTSSQHAMRRIGTRPCRWTMVLAGIGAIIFIDLVDALEKPHVPERPMPPLTDARSAIIGLVKANRLRQATELALQYIDEHPADIDTHFAIADAFMRSENCQHARPYFDKILRHYRRKKLSSKIFGFKRACYPTWQRQVMVQLQAKQHIYPHFAQGWQIKPQNGSRIDQYCKFIGISCADTYFQIAPLAARKQTIVSLALAAQFAQHINQTSLYNLGLTYSRHMVGWPTLPAETLSATASLTHQAQRQRALSYGVRLGAYRKSIGDSLQSDTGEWLGFEIGAHHILRQRLMVQIKTALDQLQSNYSYGVALQTTGELSGYVTAKQNLSVAVAGINKQLSRHNNFEYSRQNTVYLTYKNRLTNQNLLIMGIEKSYEQHKLPNLYLATPHKIDGQMVKVGTELTPKHWPWIQLGTMLKWQKFKSIDAVSHRRIFQLDLYAMSRL